MLAQQALGAIARLSKAALLTHQTVEATIAKTAVRKTQDTSPVISLFYHQSRRELRIRGVTVDAGGDGSEVACKMVEAYGKLKGQKEKSQKAMPIKGAAPALFRVYYFYSWHLCAVFLTFGLVAYCLSIFGFYTAV